MSNEPHVRPRRPEDIPKLAKALAEVQKVEGYPVKIGFNDLTEFITPPDAFQEFAAVLNGEPVGNIVLTDAVGTEVHDAWLEKGGDPKRPTVNFGRYFVSRDARGAGLGRKLVEAACQWSRDNGRVMMLTVIYKQNPVKAIKLYEANGFRHLADGHLVIADIPFPSGHYVAE